MQRTAPQKPLPQRRGPSPAEMNALLALCQARQWPQAEAAAAKLLKAHPQDVALHNLHGSACSEQAQLARAVESFRRAAALAPQSPELQFNLAVTLGRLGKLDEAVAVYRRALTLKPDFAVAHYNLGTALKDLGRHADAVAALQRAVALQPGYLAAHANLGAALQALGRLDEAVASYRAALAIGPSAKGHLSLASALRARGRLDEAAAELQRAIALEPGYADAHNNLGETRWDQGEVEAALGHWRAALAIAADHAEAHYNLGILCYDGGRLDEAIPHFERSRLRDWQERRLYCLYKTRRFDAFREALAPLVTGPQTSPFLATLSAHHAANFGVADAYGFCRDPIAYVHHGRLAALAPGGALVAELLRDVEHADLAERKQGRLHHGIQSAGNLFRRPEASFRALAAAIEAEIARYRATLAGRDAEYARAFPAATVFSSSWYVKMRQGGHLTSHIHETGWLSGVVYLAMPPRAPGSEDGCIEFSTDGDGYPREHEAFPRRVVAPAVGDIVLFPSSLFHRTIPFSADTDRVCIAFDIAP
ncbi:MAG TPA: tetratricopeptide repeat protein [Methylibium sp.]|nr:tetratricopeptide repeat protein [Methylibium sp.]